MYAGVATAQAQDLNLGGFGDYAGGSAGVPVLGFLKLPASARGVGMGAASRATDEEATGLLGNPALLGLVGDYYYAVSHTEVLGEFRHENLAFTFPTATLGNFGGSANILAATEFPDARDIDENRSHPSAYDAAFGLSYARTLWQDRVSAGTRLDLIHSDIDGTGANGYAVSAGLLFMLVHDLRLAFTLDNLSHGIRYDQHADAPIEPLPLAFGAEVGKPLLDDRWSAQIGAAQGNDGITRFYGGAEWRVIRYLILRAGYDGSSQDRRLGPWSGIAAGLGIKYERITLDYGYKSMGPLGDYHSFSLSYSRKSDFQARDEVYLERARKKYRQGDYRAALALARAAIAVNPYNFKAQALAQQAALELDRLDEMAVTLAYTGNTDGHLASEWRDGKPMGGLPRRKSKLLEMKGSGGKMLILDAGDLTRPGAGLDKSQYVYGAYAQMPYDAINVGAAEARLGAERLDARLPFLASQKPLEGMRPLLSEKILKLKHGTEVRVLGAAAPAGLRAEALGGKELEAAADAVRRHALGGSGNRILVLLLHATLPEARLLAAKVPELDVIILSGEAMGLAAPMQVGKTLLCSPGTGGTHVGELTLRLDKRGHLVSFRHFLVPLDASVPEDSALKKFLEPVTVDPNKLSFDGDDDDYRSQVLAYVLADAPGKGGRLFLRDLRAGNDYEVPAGGLLCAGPILGYGKNRVAFTAEDASGAREVYAYEPGVARLDTLTSLGGRAGELHWYLRNNALLTVYAKDGLSDLYRIDPWSRETRDLTQGRFGTVTGFDLARSGDRLAVMGGGGSGATLWVTNPELEAPVAIASDRAFLGAPRWNPAGDKLAWMSANPADSAGKPVTARADTGDGESGSEMPGGELRVFDFKTKTLINASSHSRVRSFAWSADGQRIFYSAGVNLADINAFRVDSLTLSKVTPMQLQPRSEENPRPKLLGGRDGILFEAAVAGGRKLMWMDLKTLEERVLADSAGYNSLK
jgi:Tol biopolymer transport system component